MHPLPGNRSQLPVEDLAEAVVRLQPVDHQSLQRTLAPQIQIIDIHTPEEGSPQLEVSLDASLFQEIGPDLRPQPPHPRPVQPEKKRPHQN